MGFYINEYEIELKQHLNLSKSAWLTITGDMHNFNVGNTQPSFSGFLNRIFTNYYHDAGATISERIFEMRDRVHDLYATKEFDDIDQSILARIESRLIEAHQEKLINYAHSHDKGDGKKFRINKQNVEVLRASIDSEYYSNSIGLYLKALFEEYAILPTYKREQVYFKKTMDSIDIAINDNKKLEITLLEKVSENSQDTYRRKFYVSPYKIMQDKTSTYNYIVGYSEEIMNDGTTKSKQVASFRISRIDRISVLQSFNSFISKASQRALEQDILNKTPQFIAGEVSSIIVKFTKKGIENLQRQVYMRPDNIENIDTYTYVFHCTEVQAYNYLFKFGKDAVVISPSSLNEKMQDRYLSAFKAYAKEKLIK